MEIIDSDVGEQVLQPNLANLLSLGLTLHSPGEFALRIPDGWPLGGVGLRWTGILMAVAVVVGLFLSKFLAERRRLEADPGKASEQVERLALCLVIAGFIGARLYYVFTHWSDFAAHPLSVFAIWQGGILLQGALLGGTLAFYLFCRTTRINGWKYADIVAPSLALGQAIGRWSNFFNSVDYGAPIARDSSWPVRQFIPSPLRVPSVAQSETFHPIFLYESLLNLILFGVLWGMFWKAPKLKDGTWVWTYVVGYSVIRIPYELLRVTGVGNTSIWITSITSAVGLVLGIGMLVYMYRFRYDPDFEDLTQWMVQNSGLEEATAETLVKRAWKIQQQYRRAELVERVTLAMPNFPLSVAPSLPLNQREQVMRSLFLRLEEEGTPKVPPT